MLRAAASVLYVLRTSVVFAWADGENKAAHNTHPKAVEIRMLSSLLIFKTFYLLVDVKVVCQRFRWYAIGGKNAS